MSYSFFLSNYYNRGPFLHYKTRANVYMVLGEGGVVGNCFGIRYCSYLGVGGFHVLVNLLVALVFGYGMRSCQTSVILNHCIKTQFLVCISCNVHVGVTELYLRIL